MSTAMIWLLLVFIANILYGRSESTEPENAVFDPEIVEGFTEGDMDLTPDQRRALNNPLASVFRNVMQEDKYRWPNNTIPYIISNEFNEEQTNQIKSAMKHIEDKSCAHFVDANDKINGAVVIIPDSKGCHSAVGYRGSRLPQVLGLRKSAVGRDCFRLGSIVHELLHTLGFYHQHCTTDRDEYVQINYENIKDGLQGEFKPCYNVKNFEVPYDYGSVMHYSAFAFSKNGKATIETLEPDVQIGQRDGLSEGDIAKLRRMMKCDKKT